MGYFLCGYEIPVIIIFLQTNILRSNGSMLNKVQEKFDQHSIGVGSQGRQEMGRSGGDGSGGAIRKRGFGQLGELDGEA